MSNHNHPIQVDAVGLSLYSDKALSLRERVGDGDQDDMASEERCEIMLLILVATYRTILNFAKINNCVNRKRGNCGKGNVFSERQRNEACATKEMYLRTHNTDKFLLVAELKE